MPEKKTRPQVTVDPVTYRILRVLAKEEGGTISGCVRGMTRSTALSLFGVQTTSELLKVIAPLERRAS